MKDDFFEYLIATDKLDDFLGRVECDEEIEENNK